MAGKYVPPALRKQQEQAALDASKRVAEPVARTAPSGRSEFGSNPSSSGPRETREAAPPAPTNSRWKSLDEAAPVDRDRGSQRDFGDSRDSREPRSGGSGYYGNDRGDSSRGFPSRGFPSSDSRRSENSGGYGSSTNALGFHGEERPNTRLEREIFHTEAAQTKGINFDKVVDVVNVFG
jgi:hypothetical protein